MLIEENKPLAPFTTFGIGGPARWFVEATSEEQIVAAIGWARAHGVPLFVLGGGSNLLVSDAGFNGLVLRVALRGIKVIQAAEKLTPEGGGGFNPRINPAKIVGASAPDQSSPAGSSTASGQVIYQAAAGEDWDHCVQRAVDDGCAGVECLAGIPGTVGGTPVQNVGAYGQEVASAIERVRAYDLQQDTFVELPAAECGFAYRRSRFNTVDRGRYVVTRVDYRLTPGGAPTVRYAELQRTLAAHKPDGRELSLVEVAAVVRSVRESKGMLLVEGDSDCRSAGSFFKNPVVSQEQLRRIAAASARLAVGETLPPHFPAGEGAENLGRVKVPAAWLIGQAGFEKGYALGAAAISSRHTLALTNRGHATARQVLALAAEITAAVEARFGIRLEMEPVMVGF
jgi:UDP-N-acetylmuramate dehydrogenase